MGLKRPGRAARLQTKASRGHASEGRCRCPTGSRAALMLGSLRGCAQASYTPTSRIGSTTSKLSSGARGAFESSLVTPADFREWGRGKSGARKLRQQGQPAGGARVRTGNHVRGMRSRPSPTRLKPLIGLGVGK